MSRLALLEIVNGLDGVLGENVVQLAEMPLKKELGLADALKKN